MKAGAKLIGLGNRYTFMFPDIYGKDLQANEFLMNMVKTVDQIKIKNQAQHNFTGRQDRFTLEERAKQICLIFKLVLSFQLKSINKNQHYKQ